jgi:hypothetical protein
LRLNPFGLKSALFLLLGPISLAFFAWLVILYFIPDYFKKYNAKIVESTFNIELRSVYYHDLDQDGACEKIYGDYNNGNEAPRILYYSNQGNVINQWNLRGKWLYRKKLTFGDFNHNGFDEVYCFTRVGDSVFLSVIELLLKDGFRLKNRFICKTGYFNINKTDVYVATDSKLMDIDKDGFDEFVFTLYTGFSKQPRNTYSFNLISDSIHSSPHSASGFSNKVFYMDINNDGIEEVTGNVGAPENINTKMPYTDSSAWLMVLNPGNNMNFSFPPVQFDGDISSYVWPVFYKIRNKAYIMAIFTSKSAKKNYDGFWLKLFNNKGTLLRERKMLYKDFSVLNFVNPLNKRNKIYLIDGFGNTFETDTLLNIVPHFHMNTNQVSIGITSQKILDIDEDGEKEVIYSSINSGFDKLLIYRSNLSDPVILDLPGSKNTRQWNISLKKDGNGTTPTLILQTDHNIYHIRYQKSTLYYLKYPAYAGLYFLLFLAFWLLQRVQNKLAQRKFEIEKQLIHQQLAISKNQLEPHFMLNTLNNIGNMFINENREDAQYYFGKYASLLNRGLRYADKVETSLQEELEFIRDYLVLQKKRLNDDLAFTIEANEEIKLTELTIPHSLLYTFVENAIKHGLAPKKENRSLSIIISTEGKNTLILIRDNGIGRAQSKTLKTSGTGKGLLIVKNIVAGYNKLFNRDISYKVTDLIDENGIGTGTEVRIYI